VFFDEITSIGKRKGLKVISYAPTIVRKFICGDSWADKRTLSEVIVLKYPELKVYLTQDRAWKVYCTPFFKTFLCLGVAEIMLFSSCF